MYKLLLFPLSLLYGFIISLRNFLYDSTIISSTSFEISTISIGNLSLGGTGKSPHLEYIIELLRNEFNIAVLSRGYKRKTKGFQIVKINTPYEEIGDEPKQFKLKFPRVKVFVSENRVEGIKKINEIDKNIDVILLDDAFQHRKLKPKISILLTEYNNPFYEDKFFPLGNLRDSKKEYHRANIIIVTKCPQNIKPIDRRIIISKINLLPFQSIYFTKINYDSIKPCFDNSNNLITIKQIKKEKYNILIVTGIAKHKYLLEYINTNINKQTKHLNFPDHNIYTKKNINTIAKLFSEMKNERKIIITTEKDAIKFKENKYIDSKLKQHIYYIPIKIDFLFDSKQEFNTKLYNYAKKNKSDYELHTGSN